MENNIDKESMARHYSCDTRCENYGCTQRIPPLPNNKDADRINAIASENATNYGYQVAGGSPERPIISQAYKDGYITGATEQDIVARQDERENILKAVCFILKNDNYFKSDEGVSEACLEHLFRESVIYMSGELQTK